MRFFNRENSRKSDLHTWKTFFFFPSKIVNWISLVFWSNFNLSPSHHTTCLDLKLKNKIWDGNEDLPSFFITTIFSLFQLLFTVRVPLMNHKKKLSFVLVYSSFSHIQSTRVEWFETKNMFLCENLFHPSSFSSHSSQNNIIFIFNLNSIKVEVFTFVHSLCTSLSDLFSFQKCHNDRH